MAIGIRQIRAGGATVEVDADLNPLQRKLRGAQSKLKSFQGVVARIALPAVAVAGSIGVAGVAFLRAAGDAEEARNKFMQVFGDLSSGAEDFGESLSQQAGRSRTQILNLLSTFQAIGVGLGFPRESAAALSKQIAVLSLDLASFNNIADDEAMRRLVAAIGGSVEVMDKFGISIREPEVNLELLRLGINKTASEATQQQKAIARLSLINQALGRSGALGDAIRTNKSYINSLKRVRGAVFDSAAAIGSAMIPVITPIVRMFAQGAEAVRDFANNNQALLTSLTRVGVVGLAVAASLGGIVLAAVGAGIAIAGLSALLGFISVPVLVAGVAIAGVAAVIISSWNRLSSTLAPVLRATALAFTSAFNAIHEIASPVLLALRASLGSVAKLMVGPVFQSVASFRDGVVAAMLLAAFAFQNWRQVAGLAILKVGLFLTSLGEDVRHFATAQVPAYLIYVGQAVGNLAALVRQVLVNVSRNLVSFFLAVQSYLRGDGFDFVWTGLIDGFEATFAQMPIVAQRQATMTERVLQGMIDSIASSMTNDFAAFVADFNERTEGAKIELPDLLDETGDHLQGLLDNLANVISGFTESEGTKPRGVSPRGSFNPAAAGQAFGFNETFRRIASASERTAENTKRVAKNTEKIGDGLAVV